jgi:hypothetical protein
MVTVLANLKDCPTVKQMGSEWANRLEHPMVLQMATVLANQ